MKLFLTIEDDDGQKIERVLMAQKENYFNGIEGVVEDMIESLEESKKPL